MRRLIYTEEASAELVAIIEYIADESGSVEAAWRVADRIRAKCLDVASLPGTMGRARPEIHRDLRSFVVGRYVVFIRYGEPDRLVVVAIIEGHRDIDAYFQSAE